eukprot:TRINITY_DN1171_c0_g2_i2.p1 TRINITY_DN1171_c0_g2~~TRINITY_DN1171_c0_g2_i2.p1  ORF type:complete len:644 (-),score=130.58 TRINITY_DN1171_c0_g2_i2:29-1960(-)
MVVDFSSDSLWFSEDEMWTTGRCDVNGRPTTIAADSRALRRDWNCPEGHDFRLCEPVCGDGQYFGPETCDDGNQNHFDGCSSICQVEPGWVCSTTDVMPNGKEQVTRDQNESKTRGVGTTRNSAFPVSNCSYVCGNKWVPGPEDCITDQNSSSDVNISEITILACVLGTVVVVLLSGVSYMVRRRGESQGAIISENEIQLQELLGEGQFGQVFKGVWRGTTDVAVKVLKDSNLLGDGEDVAHEFKQFKEEVKVLLSLPPHPNIVQFLGVCPPNNLSNRSQRKDNQVTSSFNNITASGSSTTGVGFGVIAPDSYETNPRASSVSTTQQIYGRKPSEIELPRSVGGRSGMGTRIITEYLPEGNLVKFLRKNYTAPIDFFDVSEIANPSDQNSLRRPEYSLMLSLAKGIAAGMDHLHQNNIIHKDLAARNILIQSALSDVGDNTSIRIIPKISDFGLSGSKQRKVHIPVRWAAPEVLSDFKNSSVQSDVWSFGVVLFEISIACSVPPYHRFKKNTQVMELVMTGYQLTPPSDCPASFVSVLRSCLSFVPSLRPHFSQLFNEFRMEEARLQNGGLTQTNLPLFTNLGQSYGSASQFSRESDQETQTTTKADEKNEKGETQYFDMRQMKKAKQEIENYTGCGEYFTPD